LADVDEELNSLTGGGGGVQKKGPLHFPCTILGIVESVGEGSRGERESVVTASGKTEIRP